MEALEDLLVPIFICVVLPLGVVFLSSRTKMNADNKRAEVLIKAIETSGVGADADKIVDAMKKPEKSPREILNSRLLRGCIYSLIGLLFIMVGVIGLCSGKEFTSDPVELPILAGGASLAVGVGYLTVYMASRRHLD